MKDKNHGKSNFVEQLNRIILSYQVDKIHRQDAEGPRVAQVYQKEMAAKEALMELDNDMEASKISQEDRFIGQWSHYRVPEKLEERLSLNKVTRKEVDEDREWLRDSGSYNCYSERTIPKMKASLQYLQEQSNPSNNLAIVLRKMKNHIGREALVISNKQDIRPTPKSERKLASTIYAAVGGSQNSRPHSNQGTVKVTNPRNSYKKIKRQFGFQSHQENDPVQDKLVLAQLLKDKYVKAVPEPAPLANMLNYFTATPDRKKRSSSNRHGLDKLLS